MKKPKKSDVIMLLTGISCVFIIIGAYLAYTGLSARQSEERMSKELMSANEMNKGLQDNLKTLKELLAKEENNSSSDGPTAIYSGQEVTSKTIQDSLDPITGVYNNEKYPLGLDVTSINYLEAYGVSAYTVKYAYEQKLRREGYPEELNGYGLLQQVELIDAHTCVVKLSGEKNDLRIIYSLNYDVGIKFEEVKKEFTSRLNVDPSFFNMNITDETIAIMARYDIKTLNLIDSQIILRLTNIDYSPNNKYMTCIDYDPRSLYGGLDIYSSDYKPKLIIKDMDTGKVIYEEILADLSEINISWSSDSQRFILGNKLYYNMNNIKTRNLDEASSGSFKLITTTLSDDYIVAFGIEVSEPGLNQAVCKIYDWEYNFIEEVLLFETKDNLDMDVNLARYYYPRTLYNNTIELDYYTESSVDVYLIEISQGETKLTEIVSSLQYYKYIPELNCKLREVIGADEQATLIFEDYEGNELFRAEYGESIINGFLGSDTNEIYFYSTTVNEHSDKWINESFDLLIYNIKEDSFKKVPVPTDHLSSMTTSDTVFNWPSQYSQGILEVMTIIPIDETGGLNK